MFRRVVWIFIVFAMVAGVGAAQATAAREELADSSSAAPYMVTEIADGRRFWASGAIIRGAAFGPSSHFCVGTHVQHWEWDAQPRQRKVTVFEETCEDPQDIAVDPISWEASVAGSLPTVVQRYTWEWDDQQLSWVFMGEEVSSGVATYDLRWIGTAGQASPIVTGVPICVTYSLLMPVYPCPSKHLGTGVRRSANWEGSIHFQGVGASFDSKAPGNRDLFGPSLGIWWGT